VNLLTPQASQPGVAGPIPAGPAISSSGTVSCAGALIFSYDYVGAAEEGYRLVDYFFRRVRKRPFLEMAGERETDLVCFRGVLSSVSKAQWDDVKASLQIDRWTLLGSDSSDFYLDILVVWAPC